LLHYGYGAVVPYVDIVTVNVEAHRIDQMTLAQCRAQSLAQSLLENTGGRLRITLPPLHNIESLPPWIQVWCKPIVALKADSGTFGQIFFGTLGTYVPFGDFSSFLSYMAALVNKDVILS